MNKEAVSSEFFKTGFNCAQAVVTTFAEECGLSKELACKLSTGFGGGMGRKEEVCGAVSGGIMILGARFGRGLNDSRESMEVTYKKTQQLLDQFRDTMGSINCRTLLGGCELLTVDGQKEFVENELGANVCIPCVENVVTILNTLLEES